MMENLYRIEELFTTGWDLINSDDQKLTREQCKKRLNFYLAEGISPDRLRVVSDDD